MVVLRIATIDNISYPNLIIVTFNPVEGNVADVKEYLDVLFEILKNSEKKKTVIFDGSERGFLNPESIVYVGKYIRENKLLYTDKVIDTAFVMGTAMCRLIVKTLFLLINKELRPRSFNTMEEAKEWARQLNDNNKLAA